MHGSLPQTPLLANQELEDMKNGGSQFLSFGQFYWIPGSKAGTLSSSGVSCKCFPLRRMFRLERSPPIENSNKFFLIFEIHRAEVSCSESVPRLGGVKLGIW